MAHLLDAPLLTLSYSDMSSRFYLASGFDCYFTTNLEQGKTAALHGEGANICKQIFTEEKVSCFVGAWYIYVGVEGLKLRR